MPQKQVKMLLAFVTNNKKENTSALIFVAPPSFSITAIPPYLLLFYLFQTVTRTKSGRNVRNVNRYGITPSPSKVPSPPKKRKTSL